MNYNVTYPTSHSTIDQALPILRSELTMDAASTQHPGSGLMSASSSEDEATEGLKLIQLKCDKSISHCDHLCED